MKHIDKTAIEELHEKDVEATMAGDFQALKSLMDEECMLLPPGGESISGPAYLDQMLNQPSGSADSPKVLNLEQIWEEIQWFGDYAYERGIVRYVVESGSGNVINEEQCLKRILRRQKDGLWRVFRASWSEPQAVK